MRHPLRRLAAAPLLAALLLLPAAVADVHAQSTGAGSVVDVTSGVESLFPDGLRFDVAISAPRDVVSARVRYRVLGERSYRYNPLEFTPGRNVAASVLVRTDTSARYIPPGAEIEYTVEVTDADGAVTASAPRRFTLLDPRFDWERVEAPGVTLLYYGGGAAEARRALDAAQETLADMGALMGITDPGHLRLTLYNDVAAMRRALPFTSQVQNDNLVTEGVSLGDNGVVVVLGGHGDVSGVAAHETVHYLVRLSIGGGARSIPAWLNEGLAEYGTPFQRESYRRALEQRLADNTLLPLTSLTSAPGKPEDVILLYGQARSVVAYMVDTYGAGPLQATLGGVRDGLRIDDALEAGYGFDRVGLEQEWRAHVGAPPLTATPSRASLPTPIAQPSIVPFGVGSTPTAAPAPAPADTGA